MPQSNATGSPIDAAAGAAGPHVTAAFELLNEETRLAILLALWEAYDPRDPDTTVAFSELCDRLGVHDSGTFTYHLDRLVGRFVERVDDGYRLRNAGLKIIQAAIAGAGLGERTLPPTEIDMTCPRCGAPVEISYENEHLYHVCTACAGNTGPDFADERPVGTLMMFDFDPAGLTDRDPGEVFVAGTIKSLGEFGLLVRGLCPACSGPVEESVYVCASHDPPPAGVCSTCGTGDEVRVRYVCTVCKYGDSYPIHAAIYDHPAVVAFCHEHGVETTYALDDPVACGDLWSHLMERSYTLVSEDPLRVRISVSADRETLHLTLDGDLTVVDTTVEHDPTDSGSSGADEPTLRDVRGEGSGGRRRTDEVLPDREVCFRSLRRQRWPSGVRCPRCGGSDTIRKGRTRKGAQRYRCHTCERIFNDLTGTVFAGHRLSLPEMFHIALEAEETETTRIARQLDRSYKSVLNFVHELEDSGTWDAESIASAV